MKLFYCQINNRSVQQVVSSAGLRVICVVLHTSNVCQVVAVLLQSYNNTLTFQVMTSRRSKAATPALHHSKELLYCLASTKIDYYQAASHRIVRLPIKANRWQYWSTRIGCVEGWNRLFKKGIGSYNILYLGSRTWLRFLCRIPFYRRDLASGLGISVSGQ